MADVHDMQLPADTPVTSDTSGSASPVPGTPTGKGKTRQRLIRGLQRISSSQSLKGRSRSKSLGGVPSQNKASFSCISLTGTSAGASPLGPRQCTPTASPLATATASTTYSQDTEFPFYGLRDSQLSLRKVDTAVTIPEDDTVPPASDPKGTDSLPAQPARKSSKPPFHFWDSLPSELQVHVLSYLDPKELFQVARVSRSFSQSCFDGQLWTSLDTSEFYRDIPADALARIVTSAGPFIKTLNLRGCVQVEHYKRTEVIARACKNLMDATLEGCRNFQKSTLHSLLRSNERLVHLNLTGLSAVTNSSCKIIAESCPHLESFNVSWCTKVEAKGIKHVVDSCHKLRDLRAGEVRGFDKLDVAQSIFQRNTLERLVLSGCAELNDDALRTMVQGSNPEMDLLTDIPMVPARRLRHLDLSRCAQLTNDGVKSIAHLVPDLQGLQLSGCSGLSDAALEKVFATTPRLTLLELEELEELSNSLLSEHLAKAPCAATLEHLSLSYCENIGDTGVLPLMQKCVNIKSVDLDNTRISDLVLAEAATLIQKRATRTQESRKQPRVGLNLVVYDCQNVTWTGIREVLFRNAQVKKVDGGATYPSEIIGLKSFYGFQMTVDEHQKRVLRGDYYAAGRLERKWADYMQANEEAGVMGAGYRRRRRRAREAQALHLDEEDGGSAGTGRRRARTMGSCAVM